MRLLSLLLLCTVALGLSGCGYQVGPQKPAAYIGVTTIAVPTAENRTLEPRLASLVTSQVVSGFASDGTFELGQIESADAVMELTINQIDRRQQRSARLSTFRTRELGLTIRCDYVLRLNDETGTILRSGSVTGQSTVFPRGNYQTAERDAFQDAARRLAIDLVAETANGW